MPERSSDDTDSLPPVEHFLIQSWEAPLAGHLVVRLNAPLLTGDEWSMPVAEEAAGRAAAQRIGLDVDGAPGCRHLSGRTGNVTVTWTMAGSRRRLFPILAFGAGCGCDGGYMWWGDSELVAGAVKSAMSDPVEEGGDGFTGHGWLEQSRLEVRSPVYIVSSWVWMNEVPDPNAFRGTPFLPQPTIVRLDFTQHNTADGPKQTTVVVRHEDVPEEWLDDITAYWRWTLATADVGGFGVR